MLGMFNVSNNINTSVNQYIWYLNAVKIQHDKTTMITDRGCVLKAILFRV